MNFRTFKKKVAPFPIFATSMLGALTDRPDILKVQLTGWKHKGLVTQLRRGLYTLGSGERELEPALSFLANQIFIPSYVSMESALAYYGLIPEFVAATTSITTRATRRFQNEYGLFTYQHLDVKAYTGFRSVRESEAISFLLAVPEKAVVDFIYLNLEKFSTKNAAIFTDSYRFQNCASLKAKKLRDFAYCFTSGKLNAVVELFIKGATR